MFWLNNFLFIGVNMKTITWVQKPHHFTNTLFMYVNIVTGERVEEHTNGRCYVLGSTQKASKPSEFFVSKEFDRWDFYPGSNYDEIPTIGSYCCDGDGFIVVELLTDGSIRLLDQGDYMLDLSDNIDEAMVQAAEYVRTEYPAIFEERLFIES
jgi:hypothetical protein